MSTRNLTTLSAEEFDAIVNADVRGARGGLDEDTAAALRQPENVDRWYESLLNMKRNVEAQMTSKKAELAELYLECMVDDSYLSNDNRRVSWRDQSDHRDPERERRWLRLRGDAVKWRQGAIRFRNGLEDRLSEARLLREKANGGVDMERGTALGEVVRLRMGIAAHRDAVLANPDDSENADETLWKLVDSGV